MPDLSKLMNEEEVAAVLGVSVLTLRWWRSKQRGPDWVKIGRLVRYDAKALERFIQSNTHTPSVRATLEDKRVTL